MISLAVWLNNVLYIFQRLQIALVLRVRVFFVIFEKFTRPY